MRVAAGEMRNWLEHLNLNEELGKALAKLVIEVKTEIRFRPTEDGKLVPETTNDIKVKPPVNSSELRDELRPAKPACARRGEFSTLTETRAWRPAS